MRKKKETQRKKLVQENCDNDSNVSHIIAVSTTIDTGKSVVE